MEYLLNHCIFPIIVDGEDIGNGFIADSYFITTAYIVTKFPDCFVDINNRRYILSKETPIVLGEGDIAKDEKQLDIAIYRFEGLSSPLHLSTRKLNQSDSLKSYQAHLHIDQTTGKYFNRLSVKPAILSNSEEGNYFYCKCNRYYGSAGSPLVLGNEVVGILHGGNYEESLCAFLKVESFIFPPDSALGPQRPKPPSGGWPKLDYDPYNYDYGRIAREQYGDAFDDVADAVWNND